MANPPSLHDQSGELHMLLRSKPNALARRKALEALASKHEGIQSIGAQLLGTWGGREAVRALRERLEQLYAKPKSSGLRGVVLGALAGCITAEDAPWVLEHCFAAPGQRQRSSALHLVRALPAKAIIPRLAAESRSPRPEVRRAVAEALSALPAGERRPFLVRFATDSDPEVRRWARYAASAPSVENAS